MSERDKYLTEQMGECWHEPYFDTEENTWVGECEMKWNNNFSTWKEFGKLWEWSQKQEWFDIFVANMTDAKLSMILHKQYINPDRFADAVYTYLKEREK